jgi:hypothetical protein
MCPITSASALLVGGREELRALTGNLAVVKEKSTGEMFGK